MKLRNLRRRGRFKLPDGREVNIHVGQRVGRSESVYFYLYRQSRVYVDQATYFKLEKVQDV